AAGGGHPLRRSNPDKLLGPIRAPFARVAQWQSRGLISPWSRVRLSPLAPFVYTNHIDLAGPEPAGVHETPHTLAGDVEGIEVLRDQDGTRVLGGGGVVDGLELGGRARREVGEGQAFHLGSGGDAARITGGGMPDSVHLG